MPAVPAVAEAESRTRQVLVVDDESINRAIMAELLDGDYDVLEAADGKEALEIIREHCSKLSLVLLDLLMPVMSGMEVLEAVKSEPDLEKIPIIVMTADQESEVDCLERGAEDFISKPYPRSEVIKTRIRRAIELAEDRALINSTERDVLTGLYNKEYFYNYVNEIDLLHPNTSMDAVAVDISHFHMVNERFGRSYGNEVLKSVGQIVLETARKRGGMACRHSGDTFFAYIPHTDDHQSMFEDISSKAALNIAAKPSSQIWLRMGVYPNADKSVEVEGRFDRAKTAADVGRGSLSGTVNIYDDDFLERELYNEQLLADFREAIEQEQFIVHYQPKFDLRSEPPVLSSSEALVRWNHPRLGMIPPYAFISLFEEHELIQELDRYVWTKVARQIAAWKKKFGIKMPVSVNVSRLDVLENWLPEVLSEIVETNGLSPADLLLEITESVYTQNSEEVIETVEHLRSLGFRIELDDFGTGYSSLGMISQLPIDALKLDMSFVRTAFAEDGDTKMLEIILDIARYLEVPVIAEGVEEAEHVARLKEMGCELAQGYFFSRPVPAEEYEKILIEHRERMLGEHNAACDFEIPDAKSLHRLLSGHCSRFYCVDTASWNYIEFGIDGEYDELKVYHVGENFAQKVRELCTRDCLGADRSSLEVALSPAKLTGLILGEEPVTVVWRGAGRDRLYSLKAVAIPGLARHEVLIGITDVDGLPSTISDITYDVIAKALAADYFCIYYLDMNTGAFEEYSPTGRSAEVGFPQDGEDFFGEGRKALAAAMPIGDRESFLSSFTQVNIAEAFRRNKPFTATYRLFAAGSEIYVHFKVAELDVAEKGKAIIGISDVDEQIRRQQAYEKALLAAKLPLVDDGS